MNQIPNLEMRKTDKILLDNLVRFASQGVNMTIRVNDPVLLDADLTGNMRVVGEIILAQKTNYNKVLFRIATGEGDDSFDTIFFECFHLINDDADVINDNFFEDFKDLFEYVGNNFAYSNYKNIEEVINKALEQAKFLVWEDGIVKLKK